MQTLILVKGFFLVLITFLSCGSSEHVDNASKIRALFSQPKSLMSQVPSSPSRHEYLEDIVDDAEHLLSHAKDSKSAFKKFRLAGMLGHPGALSTAAALLLVGDAHVPRSVPLAIRFLRLAADSGQPDAHALLGYLHASGLADRHGVAKSHSRAILFWTFAAESGNTYASTALGYRHLYGIGVEKSCKLASKYYLHAARSIATDSRNWPSALNFVDGKPPLPSGLVETPPIRLNDKSILGENNDVADQDVVHFYRHSADHGNAAARTTLGALHYYGGHGVEPDEIEARRHLQIAAAAKNGEAHAMLGHLDMRARRNQSAYEHFMYAAGFHNHNAHYALGMAYRYGLLGRELDSSKAAMHFQLATEQKKHGGAYFQLGLLYFAGNGLDRDLKKAFQYFELAAKEGNIQSKLNVAKMLLDGSGPAEKSDCESGVKLLKEVAEDGEWKAVFELASERIDNGDWYGALHRYLEAAHVGIELAQYNAAFLFEKLKLSDVKELEHWDRYRMLSEAYELYEYSAMQGHTDSLIRSADVMYLEAKDYVMAAHTLGKAAQLRNAEGMVSLGLMHAQGLGVKRSRENAITYLQMAKVTDNEAIAPARVAMLGLEFYWMVEDMWNSVVSTLTWSSSENSLVSNDNPSKEMSESVTPSDRAEQADSTLRGSVNIGDRGFVSLSSDVAVVGALLVALIAVLFVRTKRLARQNSAVPRSQQER